MTIRLCITRILALFLLTAPSFSSIHYLRPKKTGSTTVASLLQEHIGEEHIYTNQREKLCQTKSASEAQSKLSTMKDVREGDCVIGHFPMWFFERKVTHNSECFWFVTLRDPIERVLSHYRDAKQKGSAIRSPCDVQSNHMCRILTSDPSLSGQALLESAISNLHKMDLVIFLEDFEYGVLQLFDELNLPQPAEIPKRNATQKAPVQPAVIEKIRKINSLDVHLYEYAIAHFGR